MCSRLNGSQNQERHNSLENKNQSLPKIEFQQSDHILAVYWMSYLVSARMANPMNWTKHVQSERKQEIRVQFYGASRIYMPC
jgi:hypothetical protein